MQKKHLIRKKTWKKVKLLLLDLNSTEIEKNRKTIRKFLKTYETAAQTHQVVPYNSIVQKMNKIVKSEAGPLTLAVPVSKIFN